MTGLLGVFLIGAAWWGVSGTAALDAQVGWANVGVLGVVAAGAGNVNWLLSGRRAVGERRRRLLADVVETPVVANAPGVEGDGSALVAAEEMTRFHRAGCALAVGKATSAATRAEHDREGRRPCGVCRP